MLLLWLSMSVLALLQISDEVVMRMVKMLKAL